MSAAAHEAEAAKEDREAADLMRHFDSRTEADVVFCGGAQVFTGTGTDPCWASAANPTVTARNEALEHRRRAAEHRAASVALRNAEAAACAGVSQKDREASPFEHKDAVVRVEPLYGPDAVGLEGAIVTFGRVPRLTTAWLQRVVDCHVARNAALGNDVPDMPESPLVPKGVTARVEEVGEGFAVTIHTSDGPAAQEVLRRAELLRP